MHGNIPLFTPLDSDHFHLSISHCISMCIVGSENRLCYYFFQLISDAGYQGEITSVSTACQQIEVFSRVLKTSACSFLEEGEQTFENNLPEFSVSL